MDSNFILKLILVPSIIGAATLAGRRWGPAVSGWLVALPLTSAPIIFFLALGHGAAFAADSAMGTLAGGISLAGFCAAYHWLAHRWRWAWWACTLAGVIVLSVGALALQFLQLPLWALLIAVIGALSLALWLIGGVRRQDDPTPAVLPRWDIPARMAAATGFVVLITAIAPLIGPRLSGLVATFPLVAGTVTVFTHRQHGPGAASGVLRGLLLGLYAFAGFYAVLIALLVPVGIGAAFGAAVAAAIVVQGVTLWIMRR